MSDKVSSLLPAVAEVTRHRHYRQHLSLLETLLHRLPHIARGLGKRMFKRHLELFLDSIFYGAVSSSCVHVMHTYCTSSHENNIMQLMIILMHVNYNTAYMPLTHEAPSPSLYLLPLYLSSPSLPPSLSPLSLPLPSLPPLSLSQTSDTALVKAAAEDCLIQLSQHLGHHILRGQVEQHCPQ